MKKNQPLNSSRRQLLARLPSYLCTSAVAMGAAQAWFGEISPAYASNSLDLTLSEASLPDISLISDSGSYFLSELADRPLLINFWATWCAPCVVELPMLEEAAQILSKDGIRLVLVSMDRGGQETAQPFLQARDITTPLSLYDPKAEMGRAIGLRGLPTTLLVKKNQAKYAMHTGPAEWNDEAIIDQLRAYLLG